MTPKRTREFGYNPRENGEAMRSAMKETGLEKEIALLRVKLESYVEQDQTDIGLILAVVNGIGRALIAQARAGGARDSKHGQLRSVMRYYGEILQGVGQERKAGNDDEPRTDC